MLRQSPKRSETFLRKILLQLFDHGQFRVEHVERLLREIAHVKACAQPYAP